MDYLFNDFKQKGIHAFRDDGELPKGEEISPHLYKAIEESRFLIVIFSNNYASSSWCLRELVKILECKKSESPKHEVRVIFYDAKPDVVRKQKRSYGAFCKHEISNSTEVGKWKEALSMAANLSGWNLEDMTNGCFCEDVQGVSKRQSLTQVQMQMIGKIMKTEDLKISSVGEGIMLEALAGSRTWFCPRSLIIFTGKDKQLLRSHKVDGIYEMESLDDYKALELFNLYAFGERHLITEDFKYLASHVVQHLQDIACAFIGEKKEFATSVLDGSHCSANAIIEVLADKFLITVYAYRLQMHELIQSMAREIMREEFRRNHKRLWISSEDYDVLNVNKVTEEVEVLVLLLKNNCQDIPIDGQALTLSFSGRLDFLSNKLRLLYWHGFPLKFLPSDFYPESIVTIDLSYSNIKHLWTTPKCFKRLKFMKLRYCPYLTSTPDFTDIANLEELTLEDMRDYTCLKSFPSNLEMDSLQILDKLSKDLGRIKTLTELHADRTAITEVPSFVSSLINLESLSICGQGRIQPRWWTSITAPFGLPSKQQHPQRSVSLNFSHCNLVQVPESIGGLPCLWGYGIKESYMIWLHYYKSTRFPERWEEAKNFVTFCFEDEGVYYEAKECGARVVCDEDLEQGETSLVEISRGRGELGAVGLERELDWDAADVGFRGFDDDDDDMFGVDFIFDFFFNEK
ncbi:NB-ARC domains-containing protein [Tanacetum coccineum]